jgi:glutamate N-acetyltransferase/amino-acid N-acetyltransferase
MSITAAKGFVAAGIAAGIKTSGAPDMSLVATEDSVAVSAAGVFTSNLAAAAPVRVSRRHLAATGGRAAAVVLTSGNANAATGARGDADAADICERVAVGLATPVQEILICQTGLIGIPLPMAPIISGVPRLVDARAPGADAAVAAATAIMTTDTIRKEALVEAAGFTVGAMAKGAAMLAPDMATMLAVLTTDAVCEPAILVDALRGAVAASFNRMTVDGATSTNDTVIVLASGRSEHSPTFEVLTDALYEACADLAGQMADDAEGATKVAHVVVVGAASDEEAHRAARKVADSNLVKCSLNGEDPYWGRVVSELGSAHVEFDIDKVEIDYGGVTVCRNGIAAPHDAKAVAEHMAQKHIRLHCDLGIGTGTAAVLATDLGYGYIDENRTTS